MGGAVDVMVPGDGPVGRASEIASEALLARLRCSEPVHRMHRDTPTTPHAWSHGAFQPESAAPVLLLDTRPAHIFEGDGHAPHGGHVQSAINVQIPTLLLRRFGRGHGGTSPGAPHDFSLHTYIHTEHGRAQLDAVLQRQRTCVPERIRTHPHFETLLHVFWFTDVVVLCEEGECIATDHAPGLAGRMLLQLLVTRQEHAWASVPDDPLLRDARRDLYYVRGGLHALRHTHGSASLFAPRGEARTPAVAPPPAMDAGRRPSLPPLTTRMPGPLAPRHSLPYLDLSGARTPGGASNAVEAVDADADAFVVSTVVPNFLYFGGNVASEDDLEHLRRAGIRAVLNTAREGHETHPVHQALREHMDAYLHIPLLDVVEQSGVQSCLARACAFLDRAWLLGMPTYVHCRAGRSRSAMIVIAYLIHARRWTLQQAYAHVAARRREVSPNIGFLAELLHFERATLGEEAPGDGGTSPRPRRSASLSSCIRPHAEGESGAHLALRGTNTPPDSVRDGRARPVRRTSDAGPLRPVKRRSMTALDSHG